MKEFVDHISHLSAATIRDYTNIVKAVVASARDEEGEQLFPRTWDEDLIDAPIIEHQRQPTTDKEGLHVILSKATGQCRVLYALSAGCGPLRAGEALGLPIENISRDCRTLYIRQKAKNGKIQKYLKTKNGIRDVDLCTSLAALLQDFIGTRTSGLLFCTSTGRPLAQSNIERRSLHPILKGIEGQEKGAFNIFRRFRITHLKKLDCPEALEHFWSGHAQTHVSERYTKLLKDRDYRLEQAEKIGLGFDLSAPVGKLGKLHVMERIA